MIVDLHSDIECHVHIGIDSDVTTVSYQYVSCNVIGKIKFGEHNQQLQLYRHCLFSRLIKGR